MTAYPAANRSRPSIAALAGLLCLNLALPACQIVPEAPPTPPAAAKPTPVTAPEPTPGAIPPATAPKPVTEKSSSATPRRSTPRTTSAAAPAAEAAPAAVDQYSVVVEADQRLRIPGPPGILKVWIGDPALKPAAAPLTQRGEERIPARLGKAAKVTPFTPGLTVTPKESQCIAIDPSGSEVQFELKAEKEGTYTVGANVDLYHHPDCLGSPTPKTAEPVKIRVEINAIGALEDRGQEVADKTWKGFLDFWTEAVGLFFALILFLLRKRLFELFGFKGKGG